MKLALPLVALLGLLTAGCGTENPRAIPHGQVLFETHCAACHQDPPAGLHTAPPKLGNLFASKTLPSGAPATDEQVREVIVHGLRTMPAFEKTMADEDVQDLIRYLHTLK